MEMGVLGSHHAGAAREHAKGDRKIQIPVPRLTIQIQVPASRMNFTIQIPIQVQVPMSRKNFTFRFRFRFNFVVDVPDLYFALDESLLNKLI